MKTIITILIVLSTAMLAQAQMPVWIQITGKPETKMVLGGEYTKEEIIKNYGQIKRIDTFYDDEIYQATISIYYFDSFYLYMIDDKLSLFSIGNPNIELHMDEWGISIKRGDDIDDYLNLPEDKAYKIETYSDHISIYPVINGVPYDMIIFLRFDKNRKVINFRWFEPV